jgi:hypothetical protein
MQQPTISVAVNERNGTVAPARDQFPSRLSTFGRRVIATSGQSRCLNNVLTPSRAESDTGSLSIGPNSGKMDAMSASARQKDPGYRVLLPDAEGRIVGFDALRRGAVSS